MNTRYGILLTAVLSLSVAALACGSLSEVAPTSEAQTQVTTIAPPVAQTPAPTRTPQPTLTPRSTSTPRPTLTPSPTPTPEPEGLMKPGIHIVGVDIQPGIYVGQAGEGLFGSCYWARLSGLTGGLEDILANDNAQGLFYVEVLATDKAFETKCELLPIDQVPARGEFLTTLTTGTYLVGRDIEPGIYRGQVGDNESCYWARLSGVTGELEDIIANDNAIGQFYVEVLPTDFALEVHCGVEKVE